MRLVEFGSVAALNTIRAGRIDTKPNGIADDVDPTLVCGNLLCSFASAHDNTTPLESGHQQAWVNKPTSAMLCTGRDADLLARNCC
jgi:hypothetical protein